MGLEEPLCPHRRSPLSPVLPLHRQRTHGTDAPPCAGQGVVQFARGAFNQRDYAVKFCVIPAVFAVERSLYGDRALQSILPNIADVCDNEDGAITDPRGNPVPPFIVMERGEALDEWAARVRPDVAAVAQARIPTPSHCHTSPGHTLHPCHPPAAKTSPPTV